MKQNTTSNQNTPVILPLCVTVDMLLISFHLYCLTTETLASVVAVIQSVPTRGGGKAARKAGSEARDPTELESLHRALEWQSWSFHSHLQQTGHLALADPRAVGGRGAVAVLCACASPCTCEWAL